MRFSRLYVYGVNIGLGDTHFIMENQMEKNIEHEMETAFVQGFPELCTSLNKRIPCLGLKQPRTMIWVVSNSGFLGMGGQSSDYRTPAI